MNRLISIITVFTVNILLCTNLYCQSNIAKSQAYYFTAQEQYEAQKYTQALDLLDKSVEAGGASNANIEALRAECYAKIQQWSKSKKALDKCFKMNPSNQILKRLSPLILRIDDELEREKEKIRQKILADKKAEEDRLERLLQQEQERIRQQQEKDRIANRDKRNKPIYEDLIKEGDKLYAAGEYEKAKRRYSAALDIEYTYNSSAKRGKSNCEAKLSAILQQKRTLETFEQREREAAQLYNSGRLGDAIKKYNSAVGLSVPESKKTNARKRIRSITSEKNNLSYDYIRRIKRYDKSYTGLRKCRNTFRFLGGLAFTAGSITLFCGLIFENNEVTKYGGITMGSGAFLLCLNWFIINFEMRRMSKKSNEYRRKYNYISLRMDQIPSWVDNSNSNSMIPSIQFNYNLNNSRHPQKLPIDF